MFSATSGKSESENDFGNVEISDIFFGVCSITDCSYCADCGLEYSESEIAKGSFELNGIGEKV